MRTSLFILLLLSGCARNPVDPVAPVRRQLPTPVGELNRYLMTTAESDYGHEQIYVRVYLMMLSHGDSSVRVTALEALRIHGTRAHVADVLQLLDDEKETSVRIVAVSVWQTITKRPPS